MLIFNNWKEWKLFQQDRILLQIIPQYEREKY